MMSSVYWRTAIVALYAGVLVFAAAGDARAQASGDGRVGPLVFDGGALDQSLHALNHHIQDKYAQEDMLAALTEDRAPEFATAAGQPTAASGSTGIASSWGRSMRSCSPSTVGPALSTGRST